MMPSGDEPSQRNQSPIDSGRRSHAPNDTFVSPWAILSIVSATLFVCPLATLAGPLFGLKAFGEMRNDPRVTGRRMAKAGIIIGTMFTIGWLALAVWWHIAARQPMLDGPSDALEAGFGGDVAGFREGFCCEADSASDDDAARFLSTLSNRYGRFVSCYQDENATPPAQPISEGLRKRIPYELEFDRATVKAEAEFVVFTPEESGPVLRFAWLKVFDDNLGDITYPQDLQELAAPPATPPVSDGTTEAGDSATDAEAIPQSGRSD